MANTNTSIEWCDATWNPVTGCTKVSPGCKGCYAEAIDRRFQHDGPHVPWTVHAQARAGVGAIHLHPERLEAPLHWRKPRRVFVNSISDLFHEEVPEEFIDKVFAMMAATPRHTYQILTKRPERMAAYTIATELPSRLAALMTLGLALRAENPGQLGTWNAAGAVPLPLPNVCLGVSVESQRWTSRLDVLAQIPAAVRFVSCEPLLSPLDLRPWLKRPHACVCAQPNGIHTAYCLEDTPVSWCIVGGESGPMARPCDIEWIRDIVRQCKDARVPTFVKQDSGLWPGRQGRIPDELWIKEWPKGSERIEG